MNVRFLIGRAGTGKTRYCFEQIVERCAADPLGTPVYWLLPKQATFTAERELTCSGDLPGGYARARVVSFQQLAGDILAECGGVTIPEIDAVGRRMILGHLLRKHREQLKFFRGVAHQVGLAAELDSAFSEFERCGKSVDDLATIVSDLEDECATSPRDASRSALCDKLHDLKLIYESYTAYLGQERLDPHRRLQQVLKCVESSKRMRGAAVYVDGFYDFTDFERKFLVGVANVSERLEIALTMDPQSRLLNDPTAPPDELGTFHPIEHTYRRLHVTFNEANVSVDEPMLFRKAIRFAAGGAVEHVEACMFSRRPAATPAHRGLALIEAPDKRSEVDAAARHIQSLLDRDGLRLREIAVLVRSLDDYHELIDAAFREHGLPYFVDRRRGAAHHPLLQLTRSLPALGLRDWDHDAAMTIAKTGLIPLGANDAETLDAADRLENYVLRHRIRGGLGWDDPKPWTYHRKLLNRNEDDDASGAKQEDDAANVEPLRRVFVDAVSPLVRMTDSPAPATLRQFVAAVYRVFDLCDVRGTLGRWIESAEARQQLEQRAEHSRVWNELTLLLDAMVDLLGDELVSPSDFVEILEAGLESFDLALTPPTVDQVLVGSVDRTRTGPRTRATIVLGLNEGTFPKRFSENSILCDRERRSLGDRKIELEPDTRRRLFDERFFAYTAFTRASEFLCVSRPMSDEQGRALSPSSFWNALRAIFPSAVPLVIPRESSPRPERVGTPRQLITTLMNWARTEAGESAMQDEPAWPALYQRLAAHRVAPERERDPINVMRERAWRALSYDNDAALSPDVAAALNSNPLQASVSRIETFATCPFRHFARYGLKLAEREEEDVTALDLGNVYHKVLEDLVKSTDYVTADPERTSKQIGELAQRVGETLRDELLLSSARNQYLLDHARRTIERVIDGQREAALRGTFRPWKAEVTFGRNPKTKDDLPPLLLPTPNGKQVELRGKIDRIDVIEREATAAVIDYKLSGHRFDVQRVYHGLSLQLLTYLLVLEASGVELNGQKLTPGAAFYVQLLRKLDAVKHPDDALAPDDPAFHLQIKPRGVFDGSHLVALDPDVAPGQTSDVVNVRILKDGRFGKGADAVEPVTFESLVLFVAKRIGELGDAILGGDVRVAPFRIGLNTTPCPRCEYRAVCRFDPAREDYRFLEAASLDDVMADLNAAGDAQPMEANDG